MRGNRLLKLLDFVVGIPACSALGWAAHLRDAGQPPSLQGARRVLIVKLSAVGDTVLAQPALTAIRTAYRNSEITCLASPVTEEVVKSLAFADRVWSFDPSRCLASPAQALWWIRRLQQGRFDLAIDFDQWSRLTALLVIMSGAPARVGFATVGQGRGWAYNVAYRPPPARHERDHFLALARAAGAISDRDLPALAVAGAEREAARSRFADTARPRIALHPGCGSYGLPRQWPVERFAEVADHLIEGLGASVFITGSPSEKVLANSIAQAMRGTPALICEAMPFADLAAILEQVDLLICGNTGPMHIAAAVGTPTVAIHGPTDPVRWGPLGDSHVVLQSRLPCSPCLNLGFEYGCTHHPCMRSIGVDEVIMAARSILERNA